MFDANNLLATAGAHHMAAETTLIMSGPELDIGPSPVDGWAFRLVVPAWSGTGASAVLQVDIMGCTGGTDSEFVTYGSFRDVNHTGVYSARVAVPTRYVKAKRSLGTGTGKTVGTLVLGIVDTVSRDFLVNL